MDDRSSSRQMIGTLVFIVAGPIVWAADLMLIYGVQSSLCAFGTLAPPVIATITGGLTLVLVAGTVLALIRAEPLFGLLTGATPPSEQWTFLRTLMQALAGLAALAMTYFALAIVLTPTCPALR